MGELRAFIIGVANANAGNVSLEKVLAKEPWRKELMDVLMEYISMVLYPTPYGLWNVAEVLLELRELMLLDSLDRALTVEAIEMIKEWIELRKKGQWFSLSDYLREFRKKVEEMDEWEVYGDGC